MFVVGGNNIILQVIVKVSCQCFISRTSDSCGYCGIDFPILSIAEDSTRVRFSVYSRLIVRRSSR